MSILFSTFVGEIRYQLTETPMGARAPITTKESYDSRIQKLPHEHQGV